MQAKEFSAPIGTATNKNRLSIRFNFFIEIAKNNNAVKKVLIIDSASGE
jgi:hypothetical protein